MSTDREGEGSAPPVAPVVMEDAMDTGQGADDEPEMTIGDKYGDGPDGSETGEQGNLRVEEAAALLGAPSDDPGRAEP